MPTDGRVSFLSRFVRWITRGRILLNLELPSPALCDTDPVRVTVSAPVPVLDLRAPGASLTTEPKPPLLKEPFELRKLESVRCEDSFADHLPEPLAELLAGGIMTFHHDSVSNQLSLRVSFSALRRLSAVEVQALRDNTHGQLLDGIGEGFQQSFAWGRTWAEQQKGLGSRLWLDFVAIELDHLVIEQYDTSPGVQPK